MKKLIGLTFGVLVLYAITPKRKPRTKKRPRRDWKMNTHEDVFVASPAAFVSLAEAMHKSAEETLGREGFARKILSVQNVHESNTQHPQMRTVQVRTFASAGVLPYDLEEGEEATEYPE